MEQFGYRVFKYIIESPILLPKSMMTGFLVFDLKKYSFSIKIDSIRAVVVLRSKKERGWPIN
jgi:hypothetical protein